MRNMMRVILAAACLGSLGAAPAQRGAGAPAAAVATQNAEPGLLFYLSGNAQFQADYANGDRQPTVLRNVTVIPDGAKGPGFQCDNTQVMAYWAPQNIYAQRGTLSFFWRARYAVGPTEFPVFRAAFADHSSWDMAWLRIDYNGHGFDAFVTDANLARTRVSVTVDAFPKPTEWTHLALAWDETRGIRFFVNGKLAAEKQGAMRFDTGLDQFGPHSRIISPHQVQSDYNFVRGGDIDEVRVYDRMLEDANIAALAKGNGAGDIGAAPARPLAETRWRDEWWYRYGWNGAAPAALEGPAISVRKVEIHDAYDLKRWWWKATDGIRETTWPGVYNRSRLPGRTDYFTLPDWDCYSVSGKAVTFVLPEEPWNHIEMSGSAWGKMEMLKADTPAMGGQENQKVPGEAVLFERAKGQEKTVNRLAGHTGGKIRFTNVEIEEPIGELSVYNVTAGRAPAGTSSVAFSLTAQTLGEDVAPLVNFIQGRYPADERAMVYGQAVAAGPPKPATTRPAVRDNTPMTSLPIVHVLIPPGALPADDGLDGIELQLPALNVKATHGDLFPMNVQVKDPIWPMRNMLDFTFSVRPGEAKTLWLDLRDRILPRDAALYLTIAAAGQDFNAASLEGARVRLVFKGREAARAEHEIDRFTQARDCYAMLVEEHPKSDRLNMWVRFERDLQDLLRVNPNHVLGRQYAAAAGIAGAARPVYTASVIPAGVPGWAYRQVELLGRVKKFVNFYVDQRQIENGEFGGGLSDDTDLTNTWPGVALMGADPEKLRESLRRELEACYANKMFTRGLPTIQVDELHSYEEGINCLAQNMILDFGNPREIERAMETQKGLETITGINAAGHRHFKTSYYSATKMAEEAPWGGTKGYSYLVVQPGQLLVDFNGNPEAKKVLLELADGMLAHRRAGVTPEGIDFKTDAAAAGGRRYFPWHLFWGAYACTGDKKYLDPLFDGGTSTLSAMNPNVLDLLDLRKTWATLGGGGAGPAAGRGAGDINWQLTGDKRPLETLFASQVQSCDALEYINTEGSLWIDRVNVPYTELQRTRLGGVALVRNSLYPGHTVSWAFKSPASDQSVAILVGNATRTSFRVIACNLDAAPVTATMTGWNVDPGMWEVTQGIDANDDDVADGPVQPQAVRFERSLGMDVTFAPHATTVLTMKLTTAGKAYWERPDLGISREDVVRAPGSITVTVHSVGSVDAPPSRVKLLDKAGRELASAPVPAMKAPLDLLPQRAAVTIPIPAGVSYEGGSIEIDSVNLEEITRLNNRVQL